MLESQTERDALNGMITDEENVDSRSEKFASEWTKSLGSSTYKHFLVWTHHRGFPQHSLFFPSSVSKQLWTWQNVWLAAWMQWHLCLGTLLNHQLQF